MNSDQSAGSVTAWDVLMNEEERFLLAILETPYDPRPALMYADWLEERDQPERAELVRLHARRLDRSEPVRYGSVMERRMRQLADVCGDPLGGVLLFRGGLQCCRLSQQSWVRSTWVLRGVVNATIEYSGRVLERVWVDGKRVAIGSSVGNSCTLRFSLAAGVEQVTAALRIAYAWPGLTIAQLHLIADDVLFYSEGVNIL
jgi:uncharacterized protein (TIGR02996 family)